MTDRPRKRFDERDTMFARMAWEQGGPARTDYYKMNPDRLAGDEELRSLPELSSPGTPSFNPLAMPIVNGVFSFLADLHPLVEQEPTSPPTKWDRATATRWATGLARHFGAYGAATLGMRPEHYYSHRGRHEHVYGREVTDMLPYGIVFSAPMDPAMIHRAPMASEAVETVKGYMTTAVTGFALAYSIRQMGYRARVHMDGNYLLVAPIVARDAGLGVVGRMGLLMDREHGPCLRLGAVTTDMPLLEGFPDRIMEAKIRAFCRICRRCADQCPGRAIDTSNGDLEASFPWKTDAEGCYANWRRIGTDCGVCLSACPFTVTNAWERLETSTDPETTTREILAEYEVQWPKRPFDPTIPEWMSLPAINDTLLDKENESI